MTEPVKFWFWMVYGQGKEPPRTIHNSPESAEREAERLARLNPGITFFVLCAIKACTVSDVVWSELKRPDAELTSERPCKCGHDIHWHEDYDFDIHECTFRECRCLQFLDRDP